MRKILFLLLLLLLLTSSLLLSTSCAVVSAQTEISQLVVKYDNPSTDTANNVITIDTSLGEALYSNTKTLPYTFTFQLLEATTQTIITSPIPEADFRVVPTKLSSDAGYEELSTATAAGCTISSLTASCTMPVTLVNIYRPGIITIWFRLYKGTIVYSSPTLTLSYVTFPLRVVVVPPNVPVSPLRLWWGSAGELSTEKENEIGSIPQHGFLGGSSSSSKHGGFPELAVMNSSSSFSELPSECFGTVTVVIHSYTPSNENPESGTLTKDDFSLTSNEFRLSIREQALMTFRDLQLHSTNHKRSASTSNHTFLFPGDEFTFGFSFTSSVSGATSTSGIECAAPFGLTLAFPSPTSTLRYRVANCSSFVNAKFLSLPEGEGDEPVVDPFAPSIHFGSSSSISIHPHRHLRAFPLSINHFSGSEFAKISFRNTFFGHPAATSSSTRGHVKCTWGSSTATSVPFTLDDVCNAHCSIPLSAVPTSNGEPLQIFSGDSIIYQLPKFSLVNETLDAARPKKMKLVPFLKNNNAATSTFTIENNYTKVDVNISLHDYDTITTTTSSPALGHTFLLDNNNNPNWIEQLRANMECYFPDPQVEESTLKKLKMNYSSSMNSDGINFEDAKLGQTVIPWSELFNASLPSWWVSSNNNNNNHLFLADDDLFVNYSILLSDTLPGKHQLCCRQNVTNAIESESCTDITFVSTFQRDPVIFDVIPMSTTTTGTSGCEIVNATHLLNCTPENSQFLIEGRFLTAEGEKTTVSFGPFECNIVVADATFTAGKLFVSGCPVYLLPSSSSSTPLLSVTVGKVAIQYKTKQISFKPISKIISAPHANLDPLYGSVYHRRMIRSVAGCDLDVYPSTAFCYQQQNTNDEASPIIVRGFLGELSNFTATTNTNMNGLSVSTSLKVSFVPTFFDDRNNDRYPLFRFSGSYYPSFTAQTFHILSSEDNNNNIIDGDRILNITEYESSSVLPNISYRVQVSVTKTFKLPTSTSDVTIISPFDSTKTFQFPSSSMLSYHHNISSLDATISFTQRNASLQCPFGVDPLTNDIAQCSNNGLCAPDSFDPSILSCYCYASPSAGYWMGEACDRCQPLYYGSTCTSQCSLSSSSSSTCNSANDGGFCEDGVTGRGCVCNTDRGWAGADCSDRCPGLVIDETSSSSSSSSSNSTTASFFLVPCSGHGSCNSLDASCSCYNSIAEGGFWSSTASSDCSLCHELYTGPNCDIACPLGTSSSLVCSGHGFCSYSSATSSSICRCQAGYCGSDCSQSGSACLLCTAGKWATGCVNECPGYTIDEFQFVTVCSGHGVCDEGQLGSGTCSCDTGYGGLDCSLSCPTYNGLICNNNPSSSSTSGGTCRADSLTCKCNYGFGGDNCRPCPVDPSTGESCTNLQRNGFCNSTDAQCVCSSGFYGAACNFSCPGLIISSSSSSSSSRLECGGHGTCTVSNPTSVSNVVATCSCYSNPTDGYWRRPSVATATSSCTLCQAGWGGAQCNVQCPIAALSGLVCNGPGKGECDSVTAKCICTSSSSTGYWTGSPACDQCTEGYYGPDCKLRCPPTSSTSSCNSCSGHGTCDDGVSGTGQCTCFANSTHGYWSVDTDCASCVGGYSGVKCNSTCPLATLSNDSSTMAVCGGRGVCSASSSGSASSVASCTCFSFSSSQFLLEDDIGGYFTGTSCDECQPGYFGLYCNETCPKTTNTATGGGSSLLCSGHGVCKDGRVSGTGECVCDPTWGTSDCSQQCPQSTSASACSGRGHCFDGATGNASCICNISDQAGEFYSPESGCSVCQSGYFGPTCSDTCASSPSSCSAIDVCPRGYIYSSSSSSSIITYAVSSSSPCSDSSGTCNIATGVCSCYSDSVNGYFQGDDCSQCQPGYTGIKCLTPCNTANGGVSLPFRQGCRCLSSSSSSSSPSLVWFGPSCNTKCPSNDTNLVCSGRGQCVVTDAQSIVTCSCQENYYGTDCSKYCLASVTCAATSSSNNNVPPPQHRFQCNSISGDCECAQNDLVHGGYWKSSSSSPSLSCDACTDGYYGDFCNRLCLCAGRGTCDRVTGACSCYSRFSGIFCERCASGWNGKGCDVKDDFAISRHDSSLCSIAVISASSSSSGDESEQLHVWNHFDQERNVILLGTSSSSSATGPVILVCSVSTGNLLNRIPISIPTSTTTIDEQQRQQFDSIVAGSILSTSELVLTLQHRTERSRRVAIAFAYQRLFSASAATDFSSSASSSSSAFITVGQPYSGSELPIVFSSLFSSTSTSSGIVTRRPATLSSTSGSMNEIIASFHVGGVMTVFVQRNGIFYFTNRVTKSSPPSSSSSSTLSQEQQQQILLGQYESFSVADYFSNGRVTSASLCSSATDSTNSNNNNVMLVLGGLNKIIGINLRHIINKSPLTTIQSNQGQIIKEFIAVSTSSSTTSFYVSATKSCFTDPSSAGKQILLATSSSSSSGNVKLHRFSNFVISDFTSHTTAHHQEFTLLQYDASWTKTIRVKSLVIDEFMTSDPILVVGFIVVEVDALLPNTQTTTSPVRVHKFDLSKTSTMKSYASVELGEISNTLFSSNLIANSFGNRMMFVPAAWSTTTTTTTSQSSSSTSSTTTTTTTISRLHGLVPVNMYELTQVSVLDGVYSTIQSSSINNNNNTSSSLPLFIDANGLASTSSSILRIQVEGLFPSSSSFSVLSAQQQHSFNCKFTIEGGEGESDSYTTPATRSSSSSSTSDDVIDCSLIPTISPSVFLSAGTASSSTSFVTCLPTILEISLVFENDGDDASSADSLFFSTNTAAHTIYRFPSPQISNIYNEDLFVSTSDKVSYSSASYSSTIIIEGSQFQDINNNNNLAVCRFSSSSSGFTFYIDSPNTTVVNETMILCETPTFTTMSSSSSSFYRLDNAINRIDTLTISLDGSTFDYQSSSASRPFEIVGNVTGIAVFDGDSSRIVVMTAADDLDNYRFTYDQPLSSSNEIALDDISICTVDIFNQRLRALHNYQLSTFGFPVLSSPLTIAVNAFNSSSNMLLISNNNNENNDNFIDFYSECNLQAPTLAKISSSSSSPLQLQNVPASVTFDVNRGVATFSGIKVVPSTTTVTSFLPAGKLYLKISSSSSSSTTTMLTTNILAGQPSTMKLCTSTASTFENGVPIRSPVIYLEDSSGNVLDSRQLARMTRLNGLYLVASYNIRSNSNNNNNNNNNISSSSSLLLSSSVSNRRATTITSTQLQQQLVSRAAFLQGNHFTFSDLQFYGIYGESYQMNINGYFYDTSTSQQQKSLPSIQSQPPMQLASCSSLSSSSSTTDTSNNYYYSVRGTSECRVCPIGAKCTTASDSTSSSTTITTITPEVGFWSPQLASYGNNEEDDASSSSTSSSLIFYSCSFPTALGGCSYTQNSSSSSPCKEGYEGPICSICSEGYYRRSKLFASTSYDNWIHSGNDQQQQQELCVKCPDSGVDIALAMIALLIGIPGVCFAFLLILHHFILLNSSYRRVDRFMLCAKLFFFYLQFASKMKNVLPYSDAMWGFFGVLDVLSDPFRGVGDFFPYQCLGWDGSSLMGVAILMMVVVMTGLMYLYCLIREKLSSLSSSASLSNSNVAYAVNTRITAKKKKLHVGHHEDAIAAIRSNPEFDTKTKAQGLVKEFASTLLRRINKQKNTNANYEDYYRDDKHHQHFKPETQTLFASLLFTCTVIVYPSLIQWCATMLACEDLVVVVAENDNNNTSFSFNASATSSTMTKSLLHFDRSIDCDSDYYQHLIRPFAIILLSLLIVAVPLALCYFLIRKFYISHRRVHTRRMFGILLAGLAKPLPSSSNRSNSNNKLNDSQNSTSSTGGDDENNEEDDDDNENANPITNHLVKSIFNTHWYSFTAIHLLRIGLFTLVTSMAIPSPYHPASSSSSTLSSSSSSSSMFGFSFLPEAYYSCWIVTTALIVHLLFYSSSLYESPRFNFLNHLEGFMLASLALTLNISFLRSSSLSSSSSSSSSIPSLAYDFYTDPTSSLAIVVCVLTITVFVVILCYLYYADRFQFDEENDEHEQQQETKDFDNLLEAEESNKNLEQDSPKRSRYLAAGGTTTTTQQTGGSNDDLLTRETPLERHRRTERARLQEIKKKMISHEHHHLLDELADIEAQLQIAKAMKMANRSYKLVLGKAENANQDHEHSFENENKKLQKKKHENEVKKIYKKISEFGM